MAEDPKETLKELENSLNSIKESGEEIVREFGGSLNNALENNVKFSQDLAKNFQKGQNITKDLNKAIKAISTTQRNLTINKIKLEGELSKAKTKADKDEIKNLLTSNNLQKQLNNDLLIELNTLQAINEKQLTFLKLQKQ